MENIAELITKEKYSCRGGGCEIELSSYGYEGEFMSAYQNYLGGGMRGSINNSCTITDWYNDDSLVSLASELRNYYCEQLELRELVDEFNEDVVGRPDSYPGL
ncbi:hypothetical protein KDA23_00480 [Candidatus Saccharibacteria bacterium]|nr:hypothetical protein [Candidatus Saccharibacteria bacterium]